MEREANFAKAYRQSRRDFIAACEKAGADAISRVHPAMAPDGKPLFCDSAAFGPRGAARALLLIDGAEDAVTALLTQGFVPPRSARLVLVHALDPFGRAWGHAETPPDWPHKTLATIATEELARAAELTVLDMDGSGAKAALAAALPKAAIHFQTVKSAAAQAEIAAAMAAL